jgi:undecaprenyl-diphosphatase
LRLGRVTAALYVLALLHIHIHLRHQFQGPPFDYLGLALAAAASWIGVPGPGEPVLIAGGVLAARHKLDIGGVLLAAWAGATVGGILGWVIGRKAGRAVFMAPGPLLATRQKAIVRGEEVFQRYAVAAILLTPSWVAGINRVRSAVYQPTNAIAAAAWAVGIGLGAYWIGPSVIDGVDDLGLVTGVLLVAAVLALVALELRRRRRRASD